MKTSSAAWFAIALLPFTAQAADVSVQVTDGPADPATLFVALFDSADGFASERAISSQSIAMQDGSARVVFSGLPPGRYAIKSFADQNGNRTLDRNLVGLPIERYGFSNDARGRMGPPTFDAAAFDVSGDAVVALRLH